MVMWHELPLNLFIIFGPFTTLSLNSPRGVNTDTDYAPTLPSQCLY